MFEIKRSCEWTLGNKETSWSWFEVLASVGRNRSGASTRTESCQSRRARGYIHQHGIWIPSCWCKTSPAVSQERAEREKKKKICISFPFYLRSSGSVFHFINLSSLVVSVCLLPVGSACFLFKHNLASVIRETSLQPYITVVMFNNHSDGRLGSCLVDVLWNSSIIW